MRTDELQRLRSGPLAGERPGGLGTVRLVVKCARNAEEVLQRAKSALEVVCAFDKWSGVDAARSPQLPAWLTNCFAPEPSARELRAYLRLSFEEKMRREQDAAWSREEWLYWFKPENRYWYWWDANVLDGNVIVIAIEVSEWPFPWDALKWLLRAAGAISVEAEQ